MFRFITYFILITLVSLAGAWLFENNGYVSIDWQDYRIETSVAFAVIAFSLLVFIGVIIIEALVWIRKAPRRISVEWTANRNVKGLTMLAEGFAALIEGDSGRAAELAKSSRRMLPKQPFTLLLSAEAARMRGDSEEENEYLNEMLGNKTTQLLGLKGLVNTARGEGNINQAITLAEKARSLKPKSDWTAPVLLDLYKKTGDWEGAKNVIDNYRRKNAFRKLFQREAGAAVDSKMLEEKALVCLMLSKKLYNEGDVNKSYKFAREAYDANPDFVPVIVNLCNNMLALGKRAGAKNLVENAWHDYPHPDLYEVYDKIYPNEKPQKKLRRFEKLIAINPESSESYKAVASLALDLGMYEVAKKNLELALEKEETKSLFKMLAETSEKSGSDRERVKELLKKAELAETNPSWVCNSCNMPSDKWEITCKRCNSYGSIVWKKYEKVTILGSDRMVAGS